MGRESDAVLEERVRIVCGIISTVRRIDFEGSANIMDMFTKYRVIPPQLLHDLDSARKQKPASTFDAVALEDILPGPSAKRPFHSNSLDDVPVKPQDILFRLAVLEESPQNHERVLRSIVIRVPPRRVRDQRQEQKLQTQKEALQDGRNAPGSAGGDVGEGEIDPVDEHDAEVECGDLHADD